MDSRKRLYLTIVAFVALAVVYALLTQVFYTPARQRPQPHQPTEIVLRAGSQAGLVSTRVLPSELKTNQTHTPAAEWVPGTPAAEIVVTRVINGETHIVAVVANLF